jgi:hypothetical protein
MELWEFQDACTGWRCTAPVLGLNFVYTDAYFEIYSGLGRFSQFTSYTQ